MPTTPTTPGPSSGGPASSGATADAEVRALLDVAVAALGGAAREGQQRMASAIVGAIESGEHLLVQAGTGTGKSLAYLVPAVHHAVTTGERVVVSTATLALQRQVITRDLPIVADALAPHLPRRPTIALLKGWHNYACLHKVSGGYPPDEPGTLFELTAAEPAGAADHPEEPADAAGAGGARPAAGRASRGRGRAERSFVDEVRAAREWVDETTTGDRDELVPGVSDRAWRQVSVTALECLGQRCPLIEGCFPERARAASREADVVVTNHAMLGVAASGSPGALPEHAVVVVDEAHELADRITAQATAELSVVSIEAAARLARRHGGVQTAALDTATRSFGSVVAQLPAERFPHGLPDDARLAVAAVRDALREVSSALRPDPKQAAESGTGIRVAQSAVLAVFEIAERMAAEPDGRDVVWCSRPGEGGAFGGPTGGAGAPTVSALYAAPLDVAGLVRTQLLAERTGVFTSATLELGASFEPAARTLGLGGEAGWQGLDVGSPFDYPRQGILYVAERLPPPAREIGPAQLDELERLVGAAGGRTLGLFSSRRAAQTAAEELRERLDVPILCQGDDQLPTLVREFAADPATCLFGTLSLWQGVDVPGPSLSLVVIDRIPFPRPDDPVRAARSEAVDAAGGNGFLQVSATHAALLLAQGSGRLIRSTDDRGVVAVLDSRLARARYGGFLQRSLPPFWVTRDASVASAALERLRT